MFFQKKTIIITNEFPDSSLKNSFISNLIGFLSALIGIGGGSFSVPTLTMFSKKIHEAVGTSAVFGFFSISTGSSKRIVAAKIGSEAFLLPDILTCPLSFFPPRTSNFCITIFLVV